MLTNNYKRYVFLIILMLATTTYAQESFYLSADKIIKNDKEKLILAQGNVEIQSGKIKTRSDSLQFNTQKNQITLEGNIKILDEQGDVVFAEKAILDRKLKDGIIKKLGILMSDESRLVASSAQKNSKKYKNKKQNKNKLLLTSKFSINNLEKNPINGGTPAIEKRDTVKKNR